MMMMALIYCIFIIKNVVYYRMIAYPVIKSFLETIKTLIKEDEFAEKLLEKHIVVLNDILSKFEELDEDGNEIKKEEDSSKIKRKGKQPKIKQEENDKKNDDDETENNDTQRIDIDNKKEEKLKNKEENDNVIINENGKRLQKTIYDDVLMNYYPNNSGTSTTQRETNISKRLRAEELQGYETMIDEVNQFINSFFK